MQSLISKDAEMLIVASEVTSEKAYRAKFHRPEWPGGASGITIGIGYDVGAGVKSKAQLHADLDGLIPAEMIKALEPTIGVTGERAHAMLASVKNVVDVPWEAAMTVFEKTDVPRWYNICKAYLPNFETLSPDCKGVLVSLAYNRGPSFKNTTSDRYREMVAIRQHMIDKRPDLIPAEIVRMKRLWVGKGQPGLLTRRDEEAGLFQRGLKAQATPTSMPAPLPAPPPVVVPPVVPVRPEKDHPDWSWNDIASLGAAALGWLKSQLWH